MFLLVPFVANLQGLTLFALSPHISSSMSKGIVVIDSFSWILGHLIALLINVSQGSIIITNNIMYLASHSSIMGILDIVYSTLFGM
jgi:hypothetical protein